AAPRPPLVALPLRVAQDGFHLALPTPGAGGRRRVPDGRTEPMLPMNTSVEWIRLSIKRRSSARVASSAAIRKRTLVLRPGMSAFGQKRSFGDAKQGDALQRKAGYSFGQRDGSNTSTAPMASCWPITVIFPA